MDRRKLGEPVVSSVLVCRGELEENAALEFLPGDLSAV